MRQSERSQRGTFPSHGTSTSRVGPGRCSNQQKPPCDLQGSDIGSAGGGVKGFFGVQRQKSANDQRRMSQARCLRRGEVARCYAPTSHHSAGPRQPSATTCAHAITSVLPEVKRSGGSGVLVGGECTQRCGELFQSLAE